MGGNPKIDFLFLFIFFFHFLLLFFLGIIFVVVLG